MAKMDKKKKNMIYLGLLVVAVGITIYILFGNSSIKPDVNSIDSLNNLGTQNVPQNFKADIFSSADFDRLQDYDTKTLDTTTKGRENPFAPFIIQLK